MIGDQLFDDIVTGFYSAASSDLPWVDALLPMQREMAAFSAHLHAIDVTLGGVGFSYEVGGVAPEARSTISALTTALTREPIYL